MRSTITIVGARTVRFILFFLSQLNSANLLPFGSIGTEYFTVGTTTSMVFVPLVPPPPNAPYTATYTVDTDGHIIVVMIQLSIMFSNNSANGESKLQVSGDGGVTFVDITNAIPTGVGQSRSGSGLWIPEIQAGINKLQFRVVGRSTDGALATINVRTDTEIVIVINKKIM